MCQYCDSDSGECCIFQNEESGTWYYDHETSEWDDYEDGFHHDYVPINYCPWCGRKL